MTADIPTVEVADARALSGIWDLKYWSWLWPPPPPQWFLSERQPEKRRSV